MSTKLLELGAILIGMAILARVAGRFGLPTIPLYLLAGLAFGDGGLVPLITTHAFVETGAEIGLILLLFTLGLEYSARELVDTIRRSAPSGVVDLMLNFPPGFIAGLVLGWGLVPALFLGGITYVTSSGIVAGLLRSRPGAGTADRPEAAIVVSILVMEDLAMAVYLPVLAALLVGGATLRGVGSVAVAVAAIFVFLWVALRYGERLSAFIFSRSDEALLLSLLGFALAMAGIAESLGVSAAVGALLAGILLSGPAAHGAEALLAPLRDLFAALFFVFIGLSVDPTTIPGATVTALALAAVGIATKVVTGRFAARRAGVDAAGQRRAGAILVARGEFSLVIAGLAAAAGLEARLTPLTVTYLLVLAIVGPILTKGVEGWRRGRADGMRSAIPPG